MITQLFHRVVPALVFMLYRRIPADWMQQMREFRNRHSQHFGGPTSTNFIGKWVRTFFCSLKKNFLSKD